jgi:hypothetical protein
LSDNRRRPCASPGTARAKRDWPPFFSKCSMVARTASRAFTSTELVLVSTKAKSTSSKAIWGKRRRNSSRCAIS